MQTRTRTHCLATIACLAMFVSLVACNGTKSSTTGSSSSGAPTHNPPDGTLYTVNTNQTTSNLAAVNPATSATLWTASYPGEVVDATVTNNIIVATTAPSGGGQTNGLTAFDGGSGKQLWQTTVTNSYQSTIGAGIVIFTQSGSQGTTTLVALNAQTGQQAWKMALPSFPLKEPIPPPPGYPIPTFSAQLTTLAIGGGMVLVGYRAGALNIQSFPFQSAVIALNAQTGAKLWTTSFASTNLPPQVIVADQSNVFITLNDPFPAAAGQTNPPATNVALDAATGKQLWSNQQAWVLSTATSSTLYAFVPGKINEQNPTTQLLAISATTGTQTWTSPSFQFSGSLAQTFALPASEAAQIVGNTVVVPEHVASTDIFNASGIVGFNAATGQQLWQLQHVSNQFATGNGSVFTEAVQLQGTLVPGQPPTLNNFSEVLEAFDASSGAQQWQHKETGFISEELYNTTAAPN